MLMASMAGFMLIALVLYIAVGVALMMLARKTGTPNGWMAFVPIANVVLMCQIARKPVWWVLLMLIPLVNLVVGIILWMEIAAVRGKPKAVGLLMLVPVVNIFVLFWLASGPDSPAAWQGQVPAAGPPAGPASWPGSSPATSSGWGQAQQQPQAAWSQASWPPASAAPQAKTMPANCPQCGTATEPGELFCSECGHKLEPVAPPSGSGYAPPASGYSTTASGYSPPGAPPSGQQAPPYAGSPATPAARPKSGSSGPILAVGGILLVGALAAALYFAFSGRSPVGRPPQMAQALAGKLTEFPVDTNAQAPAKPTQVASQTFGSKGSSSGSGGVPEKWLPPGVDKNTLQQTASSITSAKYEETPGAVPVNVHVVETTYPQNGAAATYAGGIASNVPGAQQTGVQVQSPQGEIYSGYRIQSPQVEVFVLDKQQANVVIIIYAPEPAAHALAERLAPNVGNGQGLNDYPEMQETLWRLPETPPAGLVLQEVNTVRSSDLVSEEDWNSALGSTDSAEGRELIQKARTLMPDTIVTGRYEDAQQQPFEVILADYGGARAMMVWLMLRFLGAMPEVENVSMAGGDGFAFSDQESRFVLTRRGRYIVALRSPQAAALETLTALAAGLQL
jgi:hypothetical protein